MPFNFPASPISGQTYAFSDLSWIWNGYAWNKVTATAAGGGISGGSSYLSTLLDVSLVGLTSEDFLYYDGLSGAWKNRPLDALNIDGGTY